MFRKVRLHNSTLHKVQNLLTKRAEKNGSFDMNAARFLSSKIQRSGFSLPAMSQLVVHNDIIYISGQVDETSNDVQGQTKNILSKIDALLKEGGSDKTRLLTSNIWLKDIEKDFEAMNDVWIEWMDPENKPVRATVEANMAGSNMLVEIQVTAAKK